ncbi:MAG: D-alanyl-D-alanine carboxypeptidase [Oscillospiraceae bacterium]|nr:D-alanyl-D-alanine carboxypeptidase [Oscillospiraceae bacterium]
MNAKKLAAALLGLILLFSLLTPCFAENEAETEPEPFEPEISAKAVVLMDVETHDVIYSRGEDTPLYIGPLASVMTVLLAAEAVERGEIGLNDTITAEAVDYYNIDNYNASGILIGEELTLEQLIAFAMLCSPGEACNMTARLVSGSVEEHVALMNRRAEELGCTGTTFVNVNGADADGQFSCAGDLALIAAEFMDHELLMDICCSVTVSVPATNLSQAQELKTDNYILRPDRSRYYYSNAIGIKAGYSDLSGYSLISSVRIKDKYAVAVLLGCRLEAAENGYYDIQSFVQAKKLMQWFTDNFIVYDVIDPEIPLKELPVVMGSGADTVLVRSKDRLRVFLPAGAETDGMFKYSIDIQGDSPEQPAVLSAPISMGQKLGDLYVTGNGRSYGPYSAVANTSVELSRFDVIKEKASILLGKPWVKLVFLGILLLFVIYAVIMLRVNARRAKKRREEYQAKRAEIINMHNDDDFS